MKKEEIEVLEKNGIDNKRIEALSKSLEGYKELKKELKKMQKLVISKDEEIEDLKKKVKKYDRKKLLDGLK